MGTARCMLARSLQGNQMEKAAKAELEVLEVLEKLEGAKALVALDHLGTTCHGRSWSNGLHSRHTNFHHNSNCCSQWPLMAMSSNIKLLVVLEMEKVLGMVQVMVRAMEMGQGWGQHLWSRSLHT